LILPQLPQKMKLTSKVVIIDPKIIVSLPTILIPETHCTVTFMHLDFRDETFNLIDDVTSSALQGDIFSPF
jgi:hypothetical protein